MSRKESSPKKEEKMKKIASLLFIIFIALASTAFGAKEPRKFYLTVDSFTGSQALTACAEGYHMASLWEIFDFSSLKYDTTLGFTVDDSGFGPPTSAVGLDPDFGGSGWIRTGNISSGISQIAGVDNCFVWTSSSNEHFGTIAGLNQFWGNPANVISPWFAPHPFFTNCASAFSVWCVQD